MVFFCLGKLPQLLYAGNWSCLLPPENSTSTKPDITKWLDVIFLDAQDVQGFYLFKTKTRLFPCNCIHDSVIGRSPGKVGVLEHVETNEDSTASDAAQNTYSDTFHQRPGTLVLEDLTDAVDGAVVLGARGARGHHHPSSHGV